MARLSITAFVLCALAASAAAEFNHKALQNAVTLDSVLEATSELRGEVKALMAEASEQFVGFSGGSFVSCVTSEFKEVVIIGSKLFEVASELETIANDLLDFNNCTGNIIAINRCRLGLLQDFISSAKGLKSEIKETLVLFKQSIADFKKCLREGGPSTAAPVSTAAPGTPAPASTAAPGTPAPVSTAAPGTPAPTTQGARRVRPLKLHPSF